MELKASNIRGRGIPVIPGMLLAALLGFVAVPAAAKGATSSEKTGLVLENIAALRSGDFSRSPSIFVEGYYLPTGPGGGEFILDASDETSGQWVHGLH
ncbi:MAG TPA: hypothetical protein VN685_05735 [Rhizomicrobium sp.]|nr:hypothetical protein [Rhizomicrobium sp.]